MIKWIGVVRRRSERRRPAERDRHAQDAVEALAWELYEARVDRAVESRVLSRVKY